MQIAATPRARATRGWAPRCASGTRSCCSTSTRTPVTRSGSSCAPCSVISGGRHMGRVDGRSAGLRQRGRRIPVMAVGDPVQSIYSWRGAQRVEPAAVRHRFPGVPAGRLRASLPLLTSFRNSRRGARRWPTRCRGRCEPAGRRRSPVGELRRARGRAGRRGRVRPVRDGRRRGRLGGPAASPTRWQRGDGRGSAAADDGGARAPAQRHGRRRGGAARGRVAGRGGRPRGAAGRAGDRRPGRRSCGCWWIPWRGRR